MLQRWHTFRHALELRIRYRVTRGGLWFLAALAATALAAVVSANNLLFLVLAATLATLLVSGLLGSLSLAGLEVDFVAPEHVFACRGFPGQMRVRNVKWLMPSFSIRVEGIQNAGGARLQSAVYFPVSYTHLDVYKRQHRCSSPPGLPGSPYGRTAPPATHPQ